MKTIRTQRYWRTAASLLLGLTSLSINLQAQYMSPPPPEAITDRQGLPQAFVPAIAQDQQGFIWIATSTMPTLA